MNIPLDILRYEIFDKVIPKSFVERFKINPKEFITFQSIRADARNIRNLITVNKKIYNIYKQLLKNYKVVYFLCQKYDKHREDFKRVGIITGLYDALSTGLRLPFAKSTFSNYDKYIEDDIKTFILLFPQSIHYDEGILRCRDKITPLYIACTNNIPLNIIELLLRYGADHRKPILVNNSERSILKDLNENGNERIHKIKELFDKY